MINLNCFFTINLLFSEHIGAGCHECPVLAVHPRLVYILHAPIIPDGKLDVAGNLRSGTEAQSPIEAVEHLVAEHVASRLLCRGCSLVGSNGFLCLAKQTDVKIRSGVDEQADVPSYGKLVANVEGNIQIIRSTFIVCCKA